MSNGAFTQLYWIVLMLTTLDRFEKGPDTSTDMMLQQSANWYSEEYTLLHQCSKNCIGYLFFLCQIQTAALTTYTRVSQPKLYHGLIKYQDSVPQTGKII